MAAGICQEINAVAFLSDAKSLYRETRCSRVFCESSRILRISKQGLLHIRGQLPCGRREVKIQHTSRVAHVPRSIHGYGRLCVRLKVQQSLKNSLNGLACWLNNPPLTGHEPTNHLINDQLIFHFSSAGSETARTTPSTRSCSTGSEGEHATTLTKPQCCVKSDHCLAPKMAAQGHLRRDPQNSGANDTCRFSQHSVR